MVEVSRRVSPALSRCGFIGWVGWPGSKGPAEVFLTSVAIAVSESGLVVPIEVPKVTLEFNAPFPKSGPLYLQLFILFIVLLECVGLASKFGQKVAFLIPDQRAKKLEPDFFPQFPAKLTSSHNFQWWTSLLLTISSELDFFLRFLVNLTSFHNFQW